MKTFSLNYSSFITNLSISLIGVFLVCLPVFAAFSMDDCLAEGLTTEECNEISASLTSTSDASEEETGYKPQDLPFDPYDAAVEDEYSQGGGLLDSTLITSSKLLLINRGDPLSTVLNLINIMLTLLATAFLVLLLYAGFLWVWARGNTETIEKSKKLIIQGVIGLVIILGALGIAQLIFFVIDLAV